MNRNSLSTVRAIFLLMVLVIGPLQAQSVFACEMMDKVMYGDCCCLVYKSDEDSADAGCDAAINSRDKPCCDISVEVSLDDEARQCSPIVKPVEEHSDVEPPTAMVASLDIFETPHARMAVYTATPLLDVGYSGSDIYLLTQRLRI